MGSARLTVVTPECIRLEYSPTGAFIDAPSLLARNRREPLSVHVVPDDAGPVEFDTGAMVVRYRPDGIGFIDANLSIELPSGTTWRPSAQSARNLGGTLETLDRIRGHVPLPDGLLSRDGWHLLDDSGSHLLINGWAASRPQPIRANTDWYFFGYGSDYRAALRSLAAVAGPVPMPRRYALGSWYSRYWPYTSAEYREIVGEYDRRGYPLDVIVMDMDWHKEGWTGWSWNRELLPDAEKLLEWFHERGLAITLNLHPALGVGPHEDEYPAFMRAIGRDPATRETVPFDAGDRRYAEALFKCIHEPLEKGQGSDASSSLCPSAPSPLSPSSNTDAPRGVDFWWLDWQQEKFTRSIPDLPNLRWLNYLYFDHTSKHAERGCSFSRWAGWGDHRHPVHFSGDAHTGWESLAFQVPFTATAGNVGCFFWSHDIGGHFGPRLEEATTRWVQFGALSPVLRLHSARSGALDRRPWTYKPMYEEAMRAAFRLRSELFPYIYSMARKCHTETLPLCRPMYIDWSNEEAAYENPQQYMLGDALLVAPISSPGVGPRKVATQAVWFPGAQSEPSRASDRGLAPLRSGWYNWLTDERYDAGSAQLVAAEIDEFPLFAPGGVPIVTREPTLRMATAPLEKLVIVCYPGEPGTYHEFDLYEDDGISNAHERGEYSVTPVRVWWFESEVKVEVGIRVGSFAGMVHDREAVLELRGVEQASWARVDDQPRGMSAGTNGRVRIEGGSFGAAEVKRFAARFEPVDAKAFAKAARVRRIGTMLEAPIRDIDDVDEFLLLPPESLGVARRDALWAMLGTGLRREGDVLHLYGMDAEGLTLVERVGPTELVRQALDAASAGARGRARANLPALASAPRLGLALRRELVHEHSFWAEPQVDRYLLDHFTVPVRSFRVLGPFRYDPMKPMSEQRTGPELVNAGSRPRASYLDKSGQPTSWRECPPGDYWPNDMHKVCGGHNGEAMAYALTHVWSPEAQDVTLLIESGDRIEIWIADAKVFSSDAAGETETAVEEVRTHLGKGWNQIMAKTNEGGGGWGFRLAIDGSHELKESFDAR